jgi:ATP-dependent Lhr-like helicase
LDVLIQYIVTLAVSDGFNENELFNEVKTTFTYQNLTKFEWNWCLNFVTNHTGPLKEYMQYSKVKNDGDFYYADDKKIIRMHKLSIGTITSDLSMKIRFMRGGTVEL